jgi:Fe-S-cluster containining protein
MSGSENKNSGEVDPEEEKVPIKCFRCGICCTGYTPQLGFEEIESIAGNLSLSPQEFIRRYVVETQIGYLLRQTENGCIFLTREEGKFGALCSIYPYRPAACRDFVASLSVRQCREGLELLRKSGLENELE